MKQNRSRRRTATETPRTRAAATGHNAAAPASTPAPAGPRVPLVDAARGVAITAMIAYHFCFDLTFYRWADWPMLVDPRWIAWRSSIVASFLFLVGVSLALRDDRDRRVGSTAWTDRGFVRRWAQIAGAALVVSAGSALLFPASFIYFGVLHFVAVALWLCRRAPRLGGMAIVAGLVVLAIGLGYSDPRFDPKPIDWIGFAAEKPITEDYVPLFPWLGVVLIGCGVGALWTRHGFATSPAVERAWNVVPSALRTTWAAMGRRSLTIYLVHQPLLLGALGLVRWLAPA